MGSAPLPDGVSAVSLDQQPVDRFVRLRSDLGVGSFGINKLVLGPGQRNRIHRHRHQEEVYVVLRGVFTLAIEETEHEFGVGTAVRVAPGVRRQLINRGPDTLELLALGGMVDHEHVPRDAEAWTSWDAPTPGTPQEVPLPEDLPAGELRR